LAIANRHDEVLSLRVSPRPRSHRDCGLKLVVESRYDIRPTSSFLSTSRP
jgi:hypothetical protein